MLNLRSYETWCAARKRNYAVKKVSEMPTHMPDQDTLLTNIPWVSQQEEGNYVAGKEKDYKEGVPVDRPLTGYTEVCLNYGLGKSASDRRTFSGMANQIDNLHL